VRTAIISDIHGNLMALDAVMTDVETMDVNEIWCGGDIAWGGPWPNECIARVRDSDWTTVKGNTDVWVTGDPQSVPNDNREEFTTLAEAHDVSEDDARWLLNLPLGHAGPGQVLLVHGTPESPFVAPFPDAPTSEFVPYQGAAQLVVYGHVHRAFTRRLSDGTLVCNPGSVGIPKDGDTASYLILDQDGPELTLTHRRVPFDRRAVIAQSRRNGGPVSQWFLDAFGG
jgi:putative phosphoesterase